ncbi:MAG: DMT family transporter [Synechococcales bacterium]|nr:DMT family transporter [Synechococcales bacterium]
MMNKQAQRSPFHALSQHIPAPLYLWLATIVFAASSALTRKINMIGQMHLVAGHNPISLCNVLFVGNLCALAMMLCLFSQDLQGSEIQRLRPRDWLSLGAIGLLSGALAPALIFAALDRTTVTNVVIISRLELPLTLLLSLLLLGRRVNRYTALGAVVSCLGVAATAWLSSGWMQDLHVGRGEVMVGIATLVLSIANLLSGLYLKTVSLGIFAIMRTGIGTIVFFVLAQVLYGSHHFAEAFSPVLWGWMVIYSFLIVILGQLCWFTAQKMSTTAELTFANTLQPLIAIGMAFLILGEIPMLAQAIGGGVLFVGICFSAIGTVYEARLRSRHSSMTSQSMTSQSMPPQSMPPSQWLSMSSDFRGI